MPVYDNHAHLEIADGDEPLSARASSSIGPPTVGVIGVVQAGGDIESSRWSAWAAASHPRVLAAVAIHPNEAPAYEQAGELDEAIAVIDELAAQPRVRAIGETGLDFFRTDEDGIPGPVPARSRRTSRSRRSTGSRCRSTTATRMTPCSRRCERVGAPDRTVFHCFSGDDAMARIAADRGLLPVVRGQRDVQERAEPARRPRGDAARADPGRDGCAVPHADPASGPARTRRTSCR